MIYISLAAVGTLLPLSGLRGTPVHAMNARRSEAVGRPDAGTVVGHWRPKGDTSPWRLRFNAIHRTLRERITLLQYPPAMRLDLDALAEEHGVSRTPIRNVLQRLEHEGLVITRHGVGTTVADIDFEYLRPATELRMHLAELIGVLDSPAPDPEVVAELASLADELRPLLDRRDIERFAYIDVRVHGCICTLIGNDLMRRMYDELYFRTARMWFHFMPRLDWRSEVAVFLNDVEMTQRAMARGDVRAVGFITRNAIAAALVRLSDLLAEAEHR